MPTLSCKSLHHPLLNILFSQTVTLSSLPSPPPSHQPRQPPFCFLCVCSAFLLPEAACASTSFCRAELNHFQYNVCYILFNCSSHLSTESWVVWSEKKKDLCPLNCFIHFRINEHTHNFRYKKPQSRGSLRRNVRIWMFPEADTCPILEMWSFRKHPQVSN